MADLIERQDVLQLIRDCYTPEEIGMAMLYESVKKMPSAQPEYYDYSDIDDVWEFYAEEQNINLTDGAKQLKDAMWVGYRKGKQDAQPEPQWIPCSERLPKERDNILVTNGQSVMEAYFIQGEFYGTMIIRNNQFKVSDVTAWMPLPEPWRGET